MLVDVNVWISYLLPARTSRRPVDRLLSMALVGDLLLVVPENVTRELENAVRTKSYLAQHITAQELADLLGVLRTVGQGLPRADRPIPRLTRDIKDDYLVFLSIEHDVDVLISGDADLLSLADHIERPRIMTVREFVDEFDPE